MHAVVASISDAFAFESASGAVVDGVGVVAAFEAFLFLAEIVAADD